MNKRGALDALAALALAPAAASALHLAALTVVGQRRRSSLAAPPQPNPRFVFVVPAHNESAGIASTVASLRAVDYPGYNTSILVVADNCTDDTAVQAAAAGAAVLVRNDERQRGKGYALAAGFRAALADPTVDAVVVVDADTVVSTNLLQCAAAALASGALVMQADYRVREPFRSWRTTLMEIAFTAMHTVRNEGRERLGWSVGLRGNGMVFTREALRRCPYSSFGLVEDIEYAARLAAAGIRVAYLEGAAVRGDMPATADDAASQRLRWEEGRERLRKETAPALARQAVRDRSPMLADAAMELAAPPLVRVAVPLVAALGITLGLRRWARLPLTAGLATSALAGLGLHVVTAWRRSGTGHRGLAALAHVPAYAFWKLGLRASRGKVDEWVRTARSGEQVAV